MNQLTNSYIIIQYICIYNNNNIEHNNTISYNNNFIRNCNSRNDIRFMFNIILRTKIHIIGFLKPKNHKFTYI